MASLIRCLGSLGVCFGLAACAGPNAEDGLSPTATNPRSITDAQIGGAYVEMIVCADQAFKRAQAEGANSTAASQIAVAECDEQAVAYAQLISDQVAFRLGGPSASYTQPIPAENRARVRRRLSEALLQRYGG